jgi:hypothetical protein
VPLRDPFASFLARAAERSLLPATDAAHMAGQRNGAQRRRHAAPSGHDKQQDQPEHHHDQPADANLMRGPFRYFTERVAPGARKNEGKHPFDNQHQCDREQ